MFFNYKLEFNLNMFYISTLPFLSINFNLRLSKNIKLYSKIIALNRTKGPKTKTAPELSEFQKEVIFGLMLGDLSAEKTSLNGNTRLRFFMSIKNKDYMNHLYSIFKDYIKTPPKEKQRKKINKLTGLLQTDIWCSTLRFVLFNWVMTDFYITKLNKNIKIIPIDAEKKLTAVSLAYWIMDDGSFFKTKEQIILCTDSYSKENVLRLINILTNKFNLSCGLIKQLNKNRKISYRIRINKSSLDTLKFLVKPYIIPSMSYKLGEI